MTERELYIFLYRAVILVAAMVEEGIGFEGLEDPCDLICDLAESLGADLDDNVSEYVLDVLKAMKP